MSLRTHTFAALTLAAIMAAPAIAQEIKPGLYQVTSKMGGNSKMNDMLKQQQETMAKMTPEQRQQLADLPRQMEQMMANMTPEQRQKMNGMMGKQAGAMDAMRNMQMTFNADGSSSAKMCVTRDMVERRNFHVQQGACTHKAGPMTGGVMKVTYACSQPPSKGEGEIRVTGPGSFTSTMHMVSTAPGNKETMDLDSTSTWLGADCGNVKPIDMNALKAPADGK